MKPEVTETSVPGVDRIAEGASERIEGATSSVGTMLRRAARRLREPSRSESRLLSPRKSVADGLDRAGSYLEREGAGQLRSDVEGLVRSRPLQAMFLSLSVGYLLARSLRR